MPRAPIHTEEERLEWVSWYKAQHGRTAEQTADHFSVPVSRVRYALRTATTDWETDPFGEAASMIREACQMGLKHAGAMNELEKTILESILMYPGVSQ